ncbi:MAG: 3-phosphoshikimate 1-carboxyvinyltransferase [Bacteroidales bacterium]|nr:3-phosphoshikimate 1-carboxyvinyltransferase [Bacteroidales bacterium]
MNRSLKPSAYNAEIHIPPSKSYMQRAVAIASLADGSTTIYHYDKSNDSLAGLGVAESLGCNVEYDKGVTITPNSNPAKDTVDVGEAGLGLRLYTPICSLQGKDMTITGHGTLLSRPVDEMIEPLKQLGVAATLTNNCAPVQVHGQLKGGNNIHINASKSSQFLSGLLIALPKAQQDTTLIIDALNSRPYVEMTMEIIRQFGGKIYNDNFQTIRIPGNQHYSRAEYTVESDWSSAAAHLAAGAIAGKVVAKGLNIHSLQADKAIIDVLKSCGAEVSTEDEYVIINKKNLNAFQFDATNAPDLFPVLAALAASCNGASEIIGTERLVHKESNRAKSIAEEFAKIGINVDISTKDKMIVHGGKIHGGVAVSAHHDHRMAMALAVCALSADAPIELEDAESVAKSYPDFWKDWDEAIINA